MLHQMKLKTSPFEAIQNGTKMIEIRLFDEKRQELKKGDAIEFSKLPELTEKLQVNIIDLKQFNTFDDLVSAYPLESFGSKRWDTKQDLLNSLRQIYTVEEERQRGALAIHIAPTRK